jgi:ketosteroid isomerase-like protein
MAHRQAAVQEVIRAEQKLAAAHKQLDLEVFDRLLHPDYAIIQPGGLVEGKEETLASLRSGTRHWDIARSDQFDVRIYGDTAIVISRWRGKGSNGDVSFDYQARVLAVWVHEDGQWRNVAAQATALDQPGSGSAG